MTVGTAAAVASTAYLVGPRRWRAIVTVREPTARAIQEAIDRAGPASIVLLPAGRYAIDRPIVVRGDDVLVLGAGAGSMEFASSADGAATTFVPATEGDSDQPIVHVTGAQRFELSGIRFEGSADPGSRGKTVGVLLDDVQDFRVDHAYFAHMGFAGVRTNGTSRGVVDHCSFYAEYKPSIGTDGYGVAVYGTNALAGVPLGEQAPEDPPQATVVENSRFSLCRHAIASNKGGRYVFRDNYVTSGVVAHAVDAHGAEFGSVVGGEWVDVHDNVIEQPNHDGTGYDGWAVRVRGGTGVVWNNTIRGYRIGVSLTEDTVQRCGPVWIWGNRLDPEAKVVDARSGLRGVAPESSLIPAPGYRPHPSPHPLVPQRCGSKAPTRLGSADVCPSE
jgi:hypothetical protein